MHTDEVSFGDTVFFSFWEASIEMRLGRNVIS